PVDRHRAQRKVILAPRTRTKQPGRRTSRMPPGRSPSVSTHSRRRTTWIAPPRLTASPKCPRPRHPQPKTRGRRATSEIAPDRRSPRRRPQIEATETGGINEILALATGQRRAPLERRTSHRKTRSTHIETGRNVIRLP